MVGAVGIENNGGRDFEDLRGTRRNTKSLKRNDGERKGILIAPLMLPRFSRLLSSLSRQVSITVVKYKVGFGPKFRGADGEPTFDFAPSHWQKSVPGPQEFLHAGLSGITVSLA
jgi:hypothetical protein